jgi:hypothetical protein
VVEELPMCACKGFWQVGVEEVFEEIADNPIILGNQDRCLRIVIKMWF